MPDVSFSSLAIIAAIGFAVPLALGQIGMDLGLIREATGAALIAAGLLSALFFPIGALMLHRREPAPPAAIAGSSSFGTPA